ncbi:hypothetical protein LWP59_13975 [Amycolatopsis acidiphila]|uniref:hypothetical protein n=1 Tax=Amycolatopsis acidiphila TaxID=715473 RepID=UPI001C96F24C|nr:hypothetical protein [Amycolatopsis acidiphila]UIJ62657.1 hypothetical protein LWP59_13975 [Amycolatopsis acidiphila]
MLAALLSLAVLIAALGPALSVIPLTSLRLVVGGLLLIFGLQWLRKATLRASRHEARHDGAAIFQTAVTAARMAPAHTRGLVADWYAFTLSFKGVLLEGLELAFIALTFGSNQHDVPLAALAAGCAVAIVAVAGFAIRAPLAKVPENTLKFVVGVMLTGFGIFWGGEGRRPVARRRRRAAGYRPGGGVVRARTGGFASAVGWSPLRSPRLTGGCRDRADPRIRRLLVRLHRW